MLILASELKVTSADLREWRLEDELRAEWLKHRKTSGRWNILRRMYSLRLPHILSHRSDPYCLEWDFTPIEDFAWQDIRCLGLPFYPQFPALEYFLDFADPLTQIGIELDGAAYHDPERDRLRDERLWSIGWRIFRIPGRESIATDYSNQRSVFELIETLQEDGEPDAEYRVLRAWGERRAEGFFWALSVTYYGHPASERALAAASVILDKHKGVDFPLELDERGEA